MSLFGLKQIIVLSLVMLSFNYSKTVSSVCTHLNFATSSSAPLAFDRGSNQVWKGIPHTCHKLWTKICEISQNFKRDFTKFLEIFINITLGLPQYSLIIFFLHVKSLWKPQQCVIYVYFFIKSYVKWSKNSVRSEFLWELPSRCAKFCEILVISQCEIWHVWIQSLTVWGKNEPLLFMLFEGWAEWTTYLDQFHWLLEVK